MQPQDPLGQPNQTSNPADTMFQPSAASQPLPQSSIAASPSQNMPPSTNQPPVMPNSTPYQPLPQMPKKGLSSQTIGLIVVGVLLLISIIFGVWAFSQRSKFKNETEAIVATEVAAAEEALSSRLNDEFLEREKEPLKEYSGPDALGNVTVEYPKTWSAHVDESGSGRIPLQGYFHPNFVPGLRSGIAFALRIEVIEDDYTKVLRTYDSAVRTRKVSISPIDAENVTGVSGSRIDGEVVRDKKGSAVLFPLRDKTLLVMTESDQYKNDFDNIILKNLRFAP
jgi:hypothetical protein